jgi:hypothetical protein
MTIGTTIVLSIHHENKFFTEHVVRHFQRRTDSTVNLLLIVNDQTSPEVLELVEFLRQHPRTEMHMSRGSSDTPIGISIDLALAANLNLRERLLFTHTDLVYLEPRFWTSESFVGPVRMVSGRFVQEPLWYRSVPDPIPRPADDHLIIDTEFFFSNGLVFRSFDRAQMAFGAAPWLEKTLCQFRRANGQELAPDYPLDPFNLAHLKLAHDFETEVGSLWAYHFPKQCHVSSVLRVFRGHVRRRTDGEKRHLHLPRAILKQNSGYQWRSVLRYSIMSSYLFNPNADYVVPIATFLKEHADDVGRCWDELKPALRLFRGLADPMPYRIQGLTPDPNFHVHWH